MNKPRKPWLAALLTFLAAGLGHLYCGRAKKGICLFIGGQILLFAGFFVLLYYPPFGVLLSIVTGVSYFLYCLIDSFRLAGKFRITYKPKRYNKWYVYVIAAALAIVIIQPFIEGVVKTNIAQAFKIPSGAMLNTLQIGDHIICNKLLYKTSEAQRGDIIVFPFPKDRSINYIKRVIGLGGEVIEIRNKQVLINGDLLREPYAINTTDKIIPSETSPRDNFGPIEIPTNHVFVMGDNRDNSYDSRFWGYIKNSDIEGKAMYTYWSWDSDNHSVRWERISKEIQ
jgi:signal peptidase I